MVVYQWLVDGDTSEITFALHLGPVKAVGAHVQQRISWATCSAPAQNNGRSHARDSLQDTNWICVLGTLKFLIVYLVIMNHGPS